MYRIANQVSTIKKWFTKLVLELLAVKIKGCFSRSYCSYGNLFCGKMITICSPITEQVFDTIIIA